MICTIYDTSGKLRFKSTNWPMARSALDLVISEAGEPASLEDCPRLLMPGRKGENAMTALFVFALPFALYSIAYGAYSLGRSLARLASFLWVKLRQYINSLPEFKESVSRK